MIETVTFNYFVENAGSEPIQISVADSHVNGGSAVDFSGYIETNPLPPKSTTAFSTFGEVAVNLCFPLQLTNTISVLGVTADGTTCVDEVTSSFAIQPTMTSRAGRNGK